MKAAIAYTTIGTAVLGLIVLIATVAQTELVDRGECLHRETRTRLQPVWTGKIMMMLPITDRVCTEWEFPEGRL